MNVEVLTQNNEDNIDKAIQGLDQFSKNWCMDCHATHLKGEPVFRCGKCQFEDSEGNCLVKVFANTHEHHYPLQHFGSMSR